MKLFVLVQYKFKVHRYIVTFNVILNTPKDSCELWISKIDFWFSRIKSETAFPMIRDNKLVYMSWMITCPWSTQMTVSYLFIPKKTWCLLKSVLVLLSTPRTFKLFYYHYYHCHRKKKPKYFMIFLHLL